MRTTLLALAALSCAEADLGQAPPPPTLSLEVAPVATGVAIHARVLSSAPATQRGTVELAVSQTLAVRPGCAPSPTDDCLSPGPLPTVIARAPLDGASVALEAPAPPNLAPGQRWWIQGRVSVRGVDYVTSAIEVVVLDGAGDPDGDGVTTADELAGRTDPANPDTDGDGRPDGVDLHPLRPNHELDCADGLDEDADHLPDCEDADCFDDARCGEQQCGDAQDDDNDGLIDCDDPDCFGPGCEADGWTAWVTGGSLYVSQYYRGDQGGHTAYGAWTSWLPVTPSRAQGVHGVLRSVDAAGVHACRWSVRAVEMNSRRRNVFHQDNPAWPFPGPPRMVVDNQRSWMGDLWHIRRSEAWDASAQVWRLLRSDKQARVARSGFQIEPGCRFSDDRFLPMFLDIEHVAFDHAPRPDCGERAVARDVEGRVWYGGLNVQAWFPPTPYGTGHYQTPCDASSSARHLTRDLLPADARGSCVGGGVPQLQHPWTAEALGVCPP